MNKSALVSAVEKSIEGKVSAKDVSTVIDAVFSTIVRETTKGGNVTITGFGVFEKRRRAARKARNPRTGESVKVRATSVPAFRPSANFKDAVAKRTKLEKTGSVIGRTVTAPPVKAAKKAAPKKSVAKAVPAKKVAAKKAAPAKKAAVKKTVAKKAALKK